jgi:hypothetical membrane protein
MNSSSTQCEPHMNVTLRKMGNLSGMLAPLLWASAIIYCGSLRPEFSHYSQYISELGERTSSTEFIMRYAGFVPTGLMHVAFAAFLLVAFKGRRMSTLAAMLIAVNGIARIAAGLFPCEAGCALPRLLISQQIHTVAAAVGFFALMGAALLWGLLLRQYQHLRCLSAYAILSAVLGLVFLALTSWSDASRAGTGLYERLSSGVLSLWLLVFAARLWSLKAYATDPPPDWSNAEPRYGGATAQKSHDR